MKQYLYAYHTIVSFNQPVTHHDILLRCQPLNGTYMRIVQESFILSPGFSVSHGRDAFGNRIVYGSQRDAHTTLAYVSTGVLEMQPYVRRDEGPVPAVYAVPTPLTSLTSEQTAQWQEAHPAAGMPKDAVKLADELCRMVYDMMDYRPCSTTIHTPASEICLLRRGVCQDYAHWMIALCRIHGLPARYVCGFVEGTGETHAWVEVCDGYRWMGWDPTHNCRIEYGYVAIAHGRDASDCAVSRGLYRGMAQEQTQINVILKEL